MDKIKKENALDILTKTSMVLQNHEEFNVSDVKDALGAKCVEIGYDNEAYYLIYDNHSLTLNSKPNDQGFDNTKEITSFKEILDTIGDNE